jgi:hypothetical protein
MSTAGEPVVWSRRLLRAAFWVTRVLGPNGGNPSQARARWHSLPLAGEVDLGELKVAEVGLREAGLLRPVGNVLAPVPALSSLCQAPGPVPYEFLLGLILEETSPLWLLTAAADGEQLAAELVPEEVEDALASVIEDPARREAFLLARARTFEAKERNAIGAAGEEAIVNACKQELKELGEEEAARQVRRVSEISDELGFDVVAPRIDGSVRRLEVKATRSAALEVTVFLSRNEFETGRSDPDWRLVVVRMKRDGGHSIVGHVGGAGLVGLTPEDRHDAGCWQVARIRLPLSSLVAGLPSAAASGHNLSP